MTEKNTTENTGSLVCVGTGIGLAGQITLISKSYIENADIVFYAMPNSITDNWLTNINSNAQSLQPLYVDGQSRKQTYHNMVATMMEAVRAGKKVVGAFYGHPGVFAWPPHEAIRVAKAEGYQAHMEPGISAEACLYADLSIDPGASGCQAFEATQFMFYEHTVDTACHLILWQIGLAGDHTLKTFDSCKKNLEITVEYLNQWYPLDHQVIIYEAPFLPTDNARIDRIQLIDLPKTKLSQISTMVIPPAKSLSLNHSMLAKFGLTPEDLFQ